MRNYSLKHLQYVSDHWKGLYLNEKSLPSERYDDYLKESVKYDLRVFFYRMKQQTN